VWSIKDDGGTNSTLTPPNSLTPLNSGIVTITATIENGIAEGEDYVQDFDIKVTQNVGIEEGEQGKIQVYGYRNSVYINTVGALHATPLPQTVEIYDTSGRLIYQNRINDLETVISLNVTTGVYYVKLISQDNTTIMKKLTLER
jgi:hypothetical protein